MAGSYQQLIDQGLAEREAEERTAALPPEERSRRRRRAAKEWARKHFPAGEVYAAWSVALMLRWRLGRAPSPDEVRAHPHFTELLELDRRAQARLGGEAA